MEGYNRVTPAFNGSLHLPSNSHSSLSLPAKPNHQWHLPAASGRRAGDAELGIFPAERYFRGIGIASIDNDARYCDFSTNTRDSSASSAVVTPTASSEASWNSRSGLLSNPPVSAAVKRNASPASEQNKKPSSGHRWFRLFGQGCPCAGKKSVSVKPNSPIRPIQPKLENNSNVGAKKQSCETEELSATEEEVTKVKITPGYWAKGDTFFDKKPIFSAKSPPLATFPVEIGRRIANSCNGFSFPNINSTAISASDEPLRDSLEIFHQVEEGNNSAILRKPAVKQTLAGNCGRKSFTYAVPPVLEEEAASDASSDLFELESFASGASSMYPAYQRSRRNSAEELMAAVEEAPSECVYPPSEVSVVWSVDTAEGGCDGASAANFSSAASGCFDEFRFLQAEHDKFAAAMSGGGRDGGAGKKNAGSGGGGGGGGGGGFLNSCRCEKAVSVGPSPVRLDAEQQRQPAPVRSVEPEVEPARFVRLGNGNVVRCRPARVYVPVRR